MKPRRRRRIWTPLHRLTRPSLVQLFLATFYALTLMASAHQQGAFYDDFLLVDILPDSPVPLQQRDPSQQLVARQSNESITLPANAIVSHDISPETTNFWTLSLAHLNVSGSEMVYITVSICTQPFPRPGLNATQVYLTETLPPLQIYVSMDGANSRPGPGSNPPIDPLNLTLGYASVDLLGVTNDVFLSVVAGNISSNWQGSWSYQIGASTQAPLQDVVEGQNLYVIDTSQTNALITTGNLTTSEPQTFAIYTVLKDSDFVFSSLSRSFCVFRSNPSLFTTANADVSMTTRGAGGLPKQQFFLQGLNASTAYNVYLTLPSNQTNNAGTVFAPSVSLETKTGNACELVFNLDFCTETAYAAPSNPTTFNSTALARFYDNLAEQLYANFTLSLQLTPCNTTTSAQYSLFRNCSTCLSAYKNWLCAVTIPRCTDFSNDASFLFPRPLNSSRNPVISQTVQPGPYKEMMPCSQLCWGLEQNCPATLGFQCPVSGSFAMQSSYVEDDSGRTCNLPQLQYLASGVGRFGVAGWGCIVVLLHWAFWILWD